MPKTPLDFGKGFYETKESAFASMDSLNMYPRAADGEAVNNYYSVQVPSLESFGGGLSGNHAYRGSVVHNGDLYAIFGNSGMYLFNTGTQNWEKKGPLAIGGDARAMVGMASNGIVIAVTVGYGGTSPNNSDFFYDPVANISTPMNQAPSNEYATLAPNGSRDVTYVDGYFVFVGDDDDGNPRCYHSSLKTISNGTTFRTTDIAFLDAADGNAAAVTSINGQLVAICTFHMEFFQNVGGANFAFQRLKGQTQYIGFPNRGFKVQYGDDLYFIGQRRNQRFSIYSLRNGRISNTPVDAYFEEKVPESEFSSVRAWGYRFMGEEFIAFNMPTDHTLTDPKGRTYVFGVQSGLWHRRETQYTSMLSVVDRPYWAQEAQTVNNQLILFGDIAITGRASAVYSRDGESTYYGGDFGDLVGFGNLNRYEVTAPFVQNDGNGIITNNISIYVSGAARQEYELSYKDNPSLASYTAAGTVTLGPELLAGNQTKLEWRRLGFTPTQRLYKITARRGLSSDDTALRVIKGIADVEVLNG